MPASPPGDTVPARFFRQAAGFSQKPLFLVKRSGAYQPVAWRQAQQDVLALATFFLHRQVEPGDRVVILSENRMEWALADLAIQSAGAWSVPIYPTLTAQDIAGICRDCQPKWCVASTPEQAAKLLEVSREVGSIQGILVVDPGATEGGPVMSWTAALSEGASLEPKLRSLLARRMQSIRAVDTATLIYTSGTTGEPKGVMLSHQNFLSNVDASLQVIPIGPTDVHLSFLPLSHVFERMAGWYLMFTAGAAVAYAENMDTIQQNMTEVRPTVMLGVPRFFEKLYARIQDGLRQAPPLKQKMAAWAIAVGQEVAACRAAGRRVPLRLAIAHRVADRLVYGKMKARLGGRLRFFVSGSAPLSRTIGEFFYSLGVTIIEGYGLTETSPVITVNRLEAPLFGSVGPAIPGVEVWIAEDGEILTRGPHVMQGYYRKPEATASSIVDGWLHTGDIGHLDAEGRLFITDRKKDLIKTAGGKFVAPQKLEGLFITDPAVAQAFVYGDRQPYCVALIVPNMDHLRRAAQELGVAGSSAAELVANPKIQAWYWARVDAKQLHLPNFERVKRIALLDQEFSQASGELTPTLKAKRATIAQRYERLLQELYQTPAT